jgi:hypothetical protein
MTVLAPIVDVPECVCEKRFHPDSHHVQMKHRRVIDELWEMVTVGRYMIAARVPLPDAAKAMTYTIRRGLVRASWRLPKGVRSSFPAPVRRIALRVLTP